MYARWSTEEEIRNNSIKASKKNLNKEGGIPLMYDEDSVFLSSNDSHTLVIGSTGSGKTQGIILPSIRLAAIANESMIINDTNGELYDKLNEDLKKKKYKTVFLNFFNPTKGDSWNPLTLPYKLYKEGKKDNALDAIENIGYYLFEKKLNEDIDPFWINSTIDYFSGIVLYLFNNAKEENININNIYNTSVELEKDANKYLEKMSKESEEYKFLSNVLLAPKDTKGSIISVFNQKINSYINRENVSKLMSKTNFDIKNICNEKTAIFIIGGNQNRKNILIPLFVNQYLLILENYWDKIQKTNIFLDEFESLTPFENFARLIRNSRSKGVKIIATINGFSDLTNTYGTDNTEIIKMCFNNIVYLLSNDSTTLKEISNLCGNTQNKNNEITPLTTVEELKTLKRFEAVILVTRMMPIKTKLIPDYEIDWNLK